MNETKVEDVKVAENIPNVSGSGNGRMVAILVAVVLVVALAAVGFLYFMGKSADNFSEEAALPTAVPTKIVEQMVTATPVPTQPQSSGSAETLPPLSSGNSADDILKDLNSTSIDSFNSDFTDLQKDAAGL